MAQSVLHWRDTLLFVRLVAYDHDHTNPDPRQDGLFLLGNQFLRSDTTCRSTPSISIASESVDLVLVESSYSWYSTLP